MKSLLLNILAYKNIVSVLSAIIILLLFATLFTNNTNDALSYIRSFATLLAVVVALFKEDIIESLKHPTLTAEMDKNDTRYIHKTKMYGGTLEGEIVYYMRVKVVNSGKSSAKDVHIYINDFQKIPNETYLKPFVPQYARWSFSNNKLDFLAPGGERYFDIGFFHNFNGYTLFNLDTDVNHYNDYKNLNPGKYKLEISIESSNCDVVNHDIIFEYGEEWKDSIQDFLASLSFDIYIDEIRRR